MYCNIMEKEISDSEDKQVSQPLNNENQLNDSEKKTKKSKNTENFEISNKINNQNINLTKNKRERPNSSQEENDIAALLTSAKKEVKNSSKIPEETKDLKNDTPLKTSSSFKRTGRTKEKNFVNNDHCELCGNGGDIILCDGCPSSYHFNCIGLKSEEIPKGKWYCNKCALIKKNKGNNSNFPPPLVENINETLSEIGRIEEEKKKKSRKGSISKDTNLKDNSFFKNFEDKACFPPDIKNINININNNNTTTLAHNSNFNINPIQPQLPYFNYPSFNFPYDLSSVNYIKALEKDLMGGLSQDKKKNNIPQQSEFPSGLNQNSFFNMMMNNNGIFNPGNNNLLMKNFMDNMNKIQFLQKNQPNLMNNLNNASIKPENPPVESKANNTVTEEASNRKVSVSPSKKPIPEGNDSEEIKEEEKNLNNKSKEHPSDTNKNILNTIIQNNPTNLQNQQQNTAFKTNNNISNNHKLDLMLMQKFLNDSKNEKKPTINPISPPITFDPINMNLLNQISNMNKVKMMQTNPGMFQQKGNPFQNPFMNPQLNNLQMFMNMFNTGQIPQANPNLQTMMYNLARNSGNLNPLLFNNLKNMMQNNSSSQNKNTNNTFPSQNTTNNNKNIRYPVEDKLLYENPPYYDLTPEAIMKPLPKERMIPSHILGKILKIWDFLTTFRAFLLISLFTPEELYYALKSNFDCEIRLINEIHISLLAVFVDHINNFETQDFVQNKDLLMLKFCAESKTPRYFLKKCWIETLKILLNSKLYKMMSTPELLEISKKLEDLTPKKFNSHLTLDDKIRILDYLINSVYETNQIKEIVKNELERKFELKREKSALDYEYKTKESRKKELEKSEKLGKAKYKIESLSQQINVVEENLATKQISKQEGLKQKKELELERERYISLLREIEDFEVVKTKINARLDEIKKLINGMHFTTIKKMGNDGCKNEYYFFKHCNSKIFMRKRTENNENLWYSYNTSEEISDLLTRLTEKGIKEKSLINNIKKVYPKKMKFKKEKSEEMKKDHIKDETESSLDSEYEYDSDDLRKMIKEWKNVEGKPLNETTEKPRKKTDFEKIYSCLFKIEEKFTEYLSQFDKEWENSVNREELKSFMQMNTDVNQFSQAFLFLVERFKNPYKLDEFNNEEEEIPEDYNHSIFSNDGKIDIYKIDERRVLAPRVKLFSKEFDMLDAEKIFLNYLENCILNISQLFFAAYAFEGIIVNFFKRRECLNKKYTQLTKEITENVKTTKEIVKEIKEKQDEKNDVIIVEKDQMKIIEESEKAVTEEENGTVHSNNNIVPEEPEEKKPKKSSSQKVQNKEARKTRPKKINWKETCYICNDFGDLICCDGCTSVVHLFCACLEKVPDEWYCEKCEKNRKKK